MTTTSSSAPTTGAAAAKPRSSAERVIVWSFILILLSFAGFEFYVKKSYESAEKNVNDKLMAGESDSKGATRLTDKDMPDLMGHKEPAYRGDPGQLYLLNSRWCEIYVWKSLVKNQFVPPPAKPEILNLFSLYSGEVKPDKVKRRTLGYDKRVGQKEDGFFSAYVMYVYYSAPDKNGVREVISVTNKRVPYHDENTTPPDDAELERRHKQNVLRSIADLEKFGPKLTDKQKEELDSWKHPPKDSDENMRNIPNWDPASNSFKSGSNPQNREPEEEPKVPAKKPDESPEADEREERRGGPKPEKPAPKTPETPAAKKPETPAATKPETPAAKTPDTPAAEKTKTPDDKEKKGKS